MTHTTHIKVEPGGEVATCTCGWLRYAPVRSMAEQYRREHEKAYAPKEGK